MASRNGSSKAVYIIERFAAHTQNAFCREHRSQQSIVSTNEFSIHLNVVSCSASLSSCTGW